MTQAANPQQNRMEFVFLFDVENGNPNGDPDAGNLPRVDPETGLGLVTDVCLKRKVRNYVQIAHPDGLDKTGRNTRDIYVREGAILQKRRAEAGAADEGKKTTTAGRDKNRELVCARYYDVRTFGAVMATEKFNAGQVRGPVQMTFAKSAHPVSLSDLSITRVAVENEGSRKDPDDPDKLRTMGRKAIIPYGLYRCSGFVSPHFARDTGFNADDLALFWEALERMFDHDRAAARGLMTARKLVVFRHENPLGNAPAHKLLERVKIRLKDEDEAKPPRQFSDYEVEVDENDMPEGVSAEEKF